MMNTTQAESTNETLEQLFDELQECVKTLTSDEQKILKAYMERNRAES